MNVSDAIKHRYSCRAYLDKPVALETIRDILNTAKHAASSVNMQPWHVAVVTGETKQRLQTSLTQAFEQSFPRNNPVKSYPDEWFEPYKSRRIAVGKAMYGALNIAREDKALQREQWTKNYRAFDAPVMLFFFLDDLPEGALLDLGQFLQNVMLCAVEQDLATCAQFALAEYPDVVARHLSEFADKTLVCGMALGYPDNEAPVNQWRTERAKYDDFVREFS